MKRYKHIAVILSFLMVLVLSEGVFAQNSNKTITSKHANVQNKITDYYLHAIYELNINKNKDLATKYFNKVINIDSTHAATLYQQSLLTDDISEKERLAEKAVLYDPDNFEYKFHLSSIYGNTRKFHKSLKLINEIQAKGKYNLATFKYQAALYDVTGNVNMAMATIDSAIVKFGPDPDILSYKGELFLRQNKTVAYLSNCKELDSVLPDNVEIKHKLGLAYGMTNNDSLAYETLEQAYKLDSTFVPLLNDLVSYHAKTRNVKVFRDLEMIFKSDKVSFLEKRNLFNDLIRNEYFYQNHVARISKALETLRKVYNYSYDAESMYSAHFMALDMVDEALQIHKKFITNDTIDLKNRIISCNTVISAYLYREKTDSVLQYTNIAIDKFCKQDNEEPLYLSYVFGEINEHSKATKLLKDQVKTIKDDSLKSVYYGSIADTYFNVDKKETAYKYYEKALKYDSNNTLVLNNYSYYLSLENKDLDKALIMSKKVLDTEPENSTYIDTYAWILYLMGKYEDAKTHQLRAVALDDTESYEIFLHYAEILTALGEDLNARRYYRKALESGADAKLIESKLEKLN